MNTGQIDTASFQMAPLIPINDTLREMEESYEMSPSEMLVRMGTSTGLDDFYPSVAIATLMKIIRDPTLAMHHTEVVKAVTFIFKALGIKSVPYIAQVIPSVRIIHILLLFQSHKKRSSGNILQITISTHIYRVKKNGSFGIKLFLKQKFAKLSGIKFVPNAWFNI